MVFQSEKVTQNEAAEGLAGERVILGCGSGCRIDLEDFVELRELNTSLDHAGTTCEAQISARILKARETAHNGTDGGAVNVSDFR